MDCSDTKIGRLIFYMDEHSPGKNWSNSFAEWGKIIGVLILNLIIHKLNHIQPTFFTYLKYIIRGKRRFKF